MMPTPADPWDHPAETAAPADSPDHPADGMAAPAAATDRLTQLREELASLDERAVGEHIAVYERANAVVAAELSALDEV